MDHDLLIKSTKLDLPKEDLDYHLIRASMVIIFLFFDYQKWFDYEAQALISLHQPRPLILYVSGFRHQGCAFISGIAEFSLLPLSLEAGRSESGKYREVSRSIHQSGASGLIASTRHLNKHP